MRLARLARRATQTVSQWFKQQVTTPEAKSLYNKFKENFLYLQEPRLTPAAKFGFYHALKRGEISFDNPTSYLSQTAWELDSNLRDFLEANWGEVKSQLNNTSYSMEELDQASDLWHEEMKASGIEGAEYSHVMVNLKGNFKGWKWVNLGVGYCEKEAESMGHCGNVGAKEGDEILSLRDPKNVPHLTFSQIHPA